MKRFSRIAHFLIYANLLTGFLSALYMVFVVYRPEGAGFGPLWSASRQIPHEFFLQRRLYALEAWVVFGFLSIYFALTTYRRK